MTTVRKVAADVTEILDYLIAAELVLNVNALVSSGTRVAWGATAGSSFLLERTGETIAQYLWWLENSQYNALLLDGSLLQMAYEVRNGVIAAHRLAYVPCPVVLDQELLDAGFPVADLVHEAVMHDPFASRLSTVVRFDYQPDRVSELHPAVHMTINEPDCRIACCEPVHVGRFADFVFRHFLHDLWIAHRAFFDSVASRRGGDRVIEASHLDAVHLAWTNSRVVSA